MEADRNKLADTLQKLKEDATKSFKNRSPKKITSLTSKDQLKTMVSDLENEIGMAPLYFSFLSYYEYF